MQNHVRETTWCEIRRRAIENNVALLRRRLKPESLLGVVVKSEAYGHGLPVCAREFVRAGADWLVVNAADEARRIRACGVDAPVYVCGYVSPDEAEDLAGVDVRVVVYDEELLEALAHAGRKSGETIPVHIKIETGTNRQGVGPEKALVLARRCAELDGVTLEGLTTHYADIEDTRDHRFAFEQLARLEEVEKVLKNEGFEVPMVHSANSAATILYPRTHGDLVRVGIAAYGLWPSNETYVVALQKEGKSENGFIPELEPVLSWKTRVVQVKTVKAGDFIGYGRSHRATHEMKLAVLPLGYFEGFDRRLSNVGHTLVRGIRAPILGRICMNMTMIDVTHVPNVAKGDEVALLGASGEERISAEQMAEWMGTINYEVVTRILPALPRKLVED